MSSHTGSTESAETALRRKHKGNLFIHKKRRESALTLEIEILICTAADDGGNISTATFVTG